MTHTRFDPTASGTWNDLANVVRTQDQDREGVNLYRRALALAPGEGRVLANLAGALGLHAWVLLQLAPDHRWLLGLGRSPWYPTLRLWRQRVRGDWAELVDRGAAALARRVAGA